MKEEQYQLIEKLRDPKYYLEHFCKIKSKQTGMIPFILNEAQKDLFNTIKKYPRIIILKARQIGYSTAVAGYFYHSTIMNPGTTSALISYNTSQAAELLDKVKTFYNSTPPDLRPTIHYNSKFEISFPNINSKMLVLPSERAGMGYTLHFCLVSELSNWEDADEKMAILEAAVPINGKLVIESTPRGTGNCYHRIWMGEDNGYVKKKYGWWWGYSSDEIAAIRKRYDPLKFAEQYGLEFLSTGRPVFSRDIIKTQRKNVLDVGQGIKLPSGELFTVYEDDGFKIYRPIESERSYIFGVDVAEGVAGGDFSTAVVWDRMTGEEVAFYRGIIAPDLLARKLFKFGIKYNTALMVIEVNNHGLTTLTTLKNLAYPNFYFRPTKLETLGVNLSDRLGWKTNKATRPILIDDFNEGLRDGGLTLHSKEIVNEMETFVYNEDNDMVPQPQYHDDSIFGAAIGFQGFKVTTPKATLEQLDYTQFWPKSSSY